MAEHCDPQHLICEAIGLLHASLDATTDAQAVYLPTAAKADALRELVRAEARVAALKLRVLAAAEDVAAETAHKDPGTWLAHQTRLDRRPCHGDHRLAQALDQRWEATATALADGAVNLPQARVVVEVLDELVDDVEDHNRRVRDRLARTQAAARDAAQHAAAAEAGNPLGNPGQGSAAEPEQGDADAGSEVSWGPERLGLPPVPEPCLEVLGPEVVAEAEQTLLVEAKHLDPHQLRILGRRLLDVVDPEGAEAREAEKLRRAEERAHRKQRLGLRKLGDGTTRLSGLVPDAVAHRLTTYLEAFAQPRKQALAADGRTMPRAKLMAIAFGDLLERLDPDRLPTHGGDATTVVITLTLTDLLNKLDETGHGPGGIAGLGHDPHDTTSHGGTITATQARRLACQAHLVPVVLGTHGQVLDLGQATRLHTPVMRKALRIRDQHCRATGCNVPATWCEAHHLIPWLHAGPTSVDNGILLCTHHHHRVHDPAYDHQLQPDRTITFHRRT